MVEQLLRGVQERWIEPSCVAATHFFGNAQCDVTNERIGVAHSSDERIEDGGSICTDAGKRNDCLETNFRTLITKRSTKPFRCAAITDFAERRDGHLANVRVGILHRNEQCRERLAAFNVGETKRGRGSHRWRIVFTKRALERSNDVFARIVGMSNEITQGACAHGRLF